MKLWILGSFRMFYDYLQMNSCQHWQYFSKIAMNRRQSLEAAQAALSKLWGTFLMQTIQFWYLKTTFNVKNCSVKLAKMWDCEILKFVENHPKTYLFFKFMPKKEIGIGMHEIEMDLDLKLHLVLLGQLAWRFLRKRWKLVSIQKKLTVIKTALI